MEIKHKSSKRRHQLGLSLMEILVSLTILGLAATFITGRVMQYLYEGQVKTTQIQIANIKGVLNEYRLKCNRYPTTEEGLKALVTPPADPNSCKRYPPDGFIPDADGKVPQDAWDNDFIYESDGNKIITLKSMGKDGTEEITQDSPKY